MGLDINAQENPNTQYLTSVKETSKLIFERLTSPLSQFHWLYPFTPSARKQEKELKILHDYATEVIVKRKAQLEAETAGATGTDDGGSKKRPSFLDILLSSTIDGRPLTNQEIREQVDTFMFAVSIDET
jgi:cytochrome P450 family 4